MDRIDPTRLDLAREFMRGPRTTHSAELQKVLKLLRWDDPRTRFTAVQTRQGGTWRLAQATGPKGTPLKVFTDAEYSSMDEIQWMIFKKRWEVHTGQRLILSKDDAIDPSDGAYVWSTDLVKKPLLGYSDQISVAPGDRIEFKVSSELDEPYGAEIVRLRSADTAHVGLKQSVFPCAIDAQYPSRRQSIQAGSYIRVPGLTGTSIGSFSLLAYIWPTTPGRGEQTLIGAWDCDGAHGFALTLGDDGAVTLRLGSNPVGDSADTQTVTTGRLLLERHWYLVAASVDVDTGRVWLGQRGMVRYAGAALAETVTAALQVKCAKVGDFKIAAATGLASPCGEPRVVGPARFFNGKIDSPRFLARVLTDCERDGILNSGELPAADEFTLGAWDFSQAMASATAVDVSAQQNHGEIVNLPTRAMKGWCWDGSEYNWQHKPQHYGAIHFHDDDLYDCGWQTDFSLTVPEDMQSGLYAAYLRSSVPRSSSDGESIDSSPAEDWIPFVVRPAIGAPRARLALILPTASYWAYANRHTVIDFPAREHVRGAFAVVDPSGLYLHHHPELSLSMYDNHSDGSGVCYSSRLRPIVSMRPGEALWQLPADTHIIDWLDEQGITYDVLTEDDIDREGADLLRPYQCVLTGTHPEYPSLAVLDAFASFQQSGGRFIYLGGNGFYWRVSYHPDLPGVMEMRRAEDGIRSWLAEGGEYYHSFSGELGGMWRRMGRAPQSVAGTGMTAQGFDVSTYYERTEHSFDPRVRFIFEGIGLDERIGDFGIIGGGAAGWEIDRVDESLGSPPHILVVARADTFSAAYHSMKEELTHTHSAITGDTSPHVHCDMAFYETDNGGAVFSASSIAWAGALSHNGYDNNVSRITENVVRRFIDPAPFEVEPPR